MPQLWPQMPPGTTHCAEFYRYCAEFYRYCAKTAGSGHAVPRPHRRLMATGLSGSKAESRHTPAESTEHLSFRQGTWKCTIPFHVPEPLSCKCTVML